MWLAQYQVKQGGPWETLGDRNWRSQEGAKAACKKFLAGHPEIRSTVAFRTIVDDGSGVIYQECQPPHRSRLVWRDVPWPAIDERFRVH